MNLGVKIKETFDIIYSKCSEQALSELRSFSKEFQTHYKEVVSFKVE